MSFYTNLRATAQKLIASKGQGALLVKQTEGVYDIATGQSPVAQSTYAVKVVVTSFKESDNGGTLVLQGDKRVIIGCEGLSVVPTKDDLLTVGGIAHSIIDIKAINPGDTAVIYIAQCRQT